MASLKSFVFVLCIKSILGGEICDPNDTRCTKRGAALAYPLFINGIEDMVESSDPLLVDSINADSTKLKYRLKNAKLVGMTDCNAENMIVHKQNKTFEYHLHCPFIESISDYSISGDIGEMFVEGEGIVNIIAENYVLKFNGSYEKNIAEDDSERVFITNYTLNIDPRGTVVFNFKNLFGGDEAKSESANKYINENWQVADKELSAHIRVFMEKFIENLNKFLNLIPPEEVFPKDS